MGFYDQPGRDGRRTSDPLKEPNSSPAKSPDYQLYRHVITDDSGSFTIRSKGCNFDGYDVGIVNVVPRDDQGIEDVEGGDQVTITPMVWDEALGRFVLSPDLDAVTIVSAGVAESFEILARGRIVFLAVTGLTGNNSCSLYCSGYRLNQV